MRQCFVIADGHADPLGVRALRRQELRLQTRITGTQQDQLRAHFVSILNPASDIQHVEVDSRKYPETAAHIKEAQGGAIWSGSTWTAGAKPPALLTIDRNGAVANRGASLSGIPTGPAGTDRDEYPPAMFK